MNTMSRFSALIIGHESLAIQCGEILRGEGHDIAAVVTRNADVRAWAFEAGLRVEAPGADLSDLSFDWLLSIANLDIIKPEVLALPTRGAVNFHDGPLPAYAGLNAPVWAALNGESEHGISWHYIEGGVDEGDLIAQARFDTAPGDTALTLNTKCYAAAIETFPQVVAELAKDSPARTPQDLSQRSYFARDDRPVAGARLDWSQSAEALTRLVAALDHGDYWNPLCVPKFEAGGRLWLARTAAEAAGSGAPGTVLGLDDTTLTVAVGQGAVALSGLAALDGTAADPADITRMGALLPVPDAAQMQALTEALAPLARTDPTWRKVFAAIEPPSLPLVGPKGTMAQPTPRPVAVPAGVSAGMVRAAFALLTARLSGLNRVDFSLDLPPAAGPAQKDMADWVPMAVDIADRCDALDQSLSAACDAARARGPFAADLMARLPGADAPLPVLGLSETAEAGLVGPSALTLAVAEGEATLITDAARVSPEAARLMADRLAYVLTQVTPDVCPAKIDILPEAERETLLTTWNATETAYDAAQCVHQAFEAQVAKTPDAPALAFEGHSLSYSDLNAAANRMAHQLIAMGVVPGSVVGLHLPRSAELLIGALAIMKAGGAYLPMDPAYPADRNALFIEDSQAKVVIANAALAKGLPAGVQVLDIEGADLSAQPETDPISGVTGSDLAYMIYTSGSTGRPKGVMVEHRNVANFFVGMDDRINHDAGGVWLAVTSLSFDISVLELFWTLARGFKLVISGDESRTLVAGDGAARGVGGMDFSLYYWGNDDGVGRDKYRSLLEGAKFADENGFVAVWTPERHFHAFGGPYPNPSVTGAAVAGLTQNIGVRAGSCVAPLHHTARIAEEWAVIDNLTNGKAGMAIASGWQPDDFVLRPENTPPENKPAMFRQIAELRKLWAGEAVEYPRKDGQMHAVVTQPRPISKQPALWVTTAGNPATWQEAGKNGCNVLTHLLGQSVDEVAEKITLYRAALREAGYNPDDFTVTLMLHSFLADTRDKAQEIAREPMKDYLRSAAGLIKQYAWAFPAFKKPAGTTNAFELDLSSLNEDEMEGILDFAFERYFNDSGLFGTVEDALERVAQVKAIGVTEIACLIDYGIPVDDILEGLKPLAQVVRAANVDVGPAEGDYSIAAQIARHGVTHLQCTPSMARMLVTNEDSAAALKPLKHIMVGGEALPGALVRDIAGLTGAHVENMYGPTETTIWSTTQTVTGRGDAGVLGIGTPIANTQVYVVDEALEPLPIGVAGELLIGGDGVTRGYHQRADLTADRFIDDPFSDTPGARLYRTGDLARWLPDGTLDFLGRADFQVKIRGYRIELGEIETALDDLPGIAQAVVIARDDQLIAYVTADGAIDERSLKGALSEVLPPQMVPSRIVRIEAFPLTPNKKVDRKALPAPGAVERPAPQPKPEAPKAEAAPIAPAALDVDVQGTVAAIWERLLGVHGLTGRDNFFDLGGHSLLAVQAHRDIRKELGVPKLAITDIFRFPVLGDLVTAVEGKLDRPAAAAAAATPATPAPAAQAPAATPAGSGDDLSDAMARRREMRARRSRHRA